MGAAQSTASDFSPKRVCTLNAVLFGCQPILLRIHPYYHLASPYITNSGLDSYKAVKHKLDRSENIFQAHIARVVAAFSSNNIMYDGQQPLLSI
jgi:hypothetical protein